MRYAARMFFKVTMRPVPSIFTTVEYKLEVIYSETHGYYSCLVFRRAELEHAAELTRGGSRCANNCPGVGVSIDYLEEQRELQAQSMRLGTAPADNNKKLAYGRHERCWVLIKRPSA